MPGGCRQHRHEGIPPPPITLPRPAAQTTLSGHKLLLDGKECKRVMVEVRSIIHLRGQQCNVDKLWGLHMVIDDTQVRTAQRGPKA